MNKFKGMLEERKAVEKEQTAVNEFKKQHEREKARPPPARPPHAACLSFLQLTLPPREPQAEALAQLEELRAAAQQREAAVKKTCEAALAKRTEELERVKVTPQPVQTGRTSLPCPVPARQNRTHISPRPHTKRTQLVADWLSWEHPRAERRRVGSRLTSSPPPSPLPPVLTGQVSSLFPY